MEDMKAVYRLNEEKLDFNTRVLGERSAVNKKATEMLKKREHYFLNLVRDVKIAYGKELCKFQSDNLKHTNNFKRFTKLFKDLQIKFERFEKSDNTRLKDIFEMNEKEAKAIVEKIIHADKVIHTQQLDIPWKPPADPYFKQMTQSQDASGQVESYQGAESQAQQSQIEAGNTHSKSDLV